MNKSEEITWRLYAAIAVKAALLFLILMLGVSLLGNMLRTAFWEKVMLTLILTSVSSYVGVNCAKREKGARTS